MKTMAAAVCKPVVVARERQNGRCDSKGEFAVFRCTLRWAVDSAWRDDDTSAGPAVSAGMGINGDTPLTCVRGLVT